MSAIFWASLALLAYTFAGYAALVMLLARWRGRPVRREAWLPRVTVVMPVYNGAALVIPKLRSILGQSYPHELLDVIVACDGCDDDTAPRALSLQDPRVRVLDFPRRRGKAACLRDAVAQARADVIVLTDVRQRLDADAVRLLLENLADPQVAGASGELVLEHDGESAFARAIDAYWRHEVRLREAEAALHSSVGATGPFYAIRRECFVAPPLDTILDDVEIPMAAVMQRRRIVYDRRAIAYDRASTTLADERRRKIRTLAGNFQVVARNPRFLLPWRNPVALQFVSHKVLRLAAPALLLACFAANAALAAQGGFYGAMMVLQLLAYGMALLGIAWPAATAFAPVRLAAAFVSLNACVVLGLVEFVANRRAHLWKMSEIAAKPERPRGT